jgi:hypothetical protein
MRREDEKNTIIISLCFVISNHSFEEEEEFVFVQLVLFFVFSPHHFGISPSFSLILKIINSKL